MFFVDLALDYYIAARAACFWNRHPLAEIQAHHAVELQLKWLLIRPMKQPWPGRRQRTVEEVRRAKHSLRRLWTSMHEDYAGHLLGRFSRYVLLLDNVERDKLRYGEFGANPIVYGQRLEDGDAVVGGDFYTVDLPRLDELFRGLLDLAECDNVVFRASLPNMLSPEAFDYYRRENPYALLI